MCKECDELRFICKKCLYHPLLDSLKEAVNNNLVMYDADATVGQFTKRLVSLVAQIVKRQKDEIKVLYVPSTVKYQIDLWETKLLENTNNEYYMMGIPIIFEDELNMDHLLYNYYLNELNAILEPNDEELVLVQSKKTYYIASY